MRRVLSPNQRRWVIGTLLIALIVRALIPVGFMPATDRPFSFQICPDGFPAALLHGVADGGQEFADAAAPAMPPSADGGAAEPADGGMLSHAGHHHSGTLPHSAADDDALAHAGHHHGGTLPHSPADGGTLAHAGHHQDDGSPLANGHPHAGDGLLAVTHHHDGPLHSHSTASAEHCVFAAAAGVFALAFAATLFAPAAAISAPDVDYLAPTFESLRFRISQPRGPPALS